MLLPRVLLLFAYIFLIPLSGSAFASEPLCKDPLRIRVSSDYLPFSYREQDGELTGLDVSFIRSVFDSIGCPITLEVMPFKRAIIDLSNGYVDMVPFASITKRRMAFASFSRPYRNEIAGLVIRMEDRDRYPMISLADAVKQELVLGHEQWSYRGETFQAFLDDPASQPHVTLVSSTTEGIRMLDAGRIDALVEMPTAVLALAAKIGLEDKFIVHPLRLWEEPVRFMYSRKTVSQELIDAVNQAIYREIQTGEYQAAYGNMALPRTNGPEID